MRALPVVILRPEPGANATLRAARALGLDAHAFPLFAVTPLDWEPVEAAQVDALVLGSANALRHGGAALEAYRGKPAYAVGETTAKAAREAGLDVVLTGRGGLQLVMPRIAPEHRRLLRLTGREHLDLKTPEGTEVKTRAVYASDPLPVPGDLAALLRQPVLALLHSGLAAEYFSQVCNSLEIERGHVHLAAIGPRVAALAGTGWASLRSSGQAEDTALLALALEMCQEVPSGSVRTTDI